MSFCNGLFWHRYVVVLKDGLPWYLLQEIALVSTSTYQKCKITS